ncbi:MAG: DUF3365 domain-containing protein [Desulfuromonadaceae bacterium]|nr:DUF3365 domain-containing protein [Desulfuromonadaceae bacterium]
MRTDDSSQLSGQSPIKKFFIAALLAWSTLAIIATIWECLDNKAIMTTNAKTMARASIEKDIMFRRWAAEHGGVYVPVTGKTPPNPWLKVPERDIVTPSGKLLTLMNPAYMTRQIFEIGQLSPNFPQGHITSLKPIRPENGPDPWETGALTAIEKGVEQQGEFQVIGGKTVFRYMYPLVTEKPCLKCHASQGYREGMMRGGISVAIPTAELDRALRQSNVNHVSIIGVVWLMGLGGIWVGFRRISSDAISLTAQRDNLNAVFDASPMPMLLVNEQITVVRCNQAFKEYCINYDALSDKRCGALLKCTNAEAEPDGCGTTPSCKSCNLLRALQEGVRNGQSTSGETTIIRDEYDGSASEAWVLFGVQAVSLDGQRHALLSFMDITGRKHLEEKLASREQEFRALAENSPDVIARYDRFCRRLYVNPAMKHLAEESADLLTGATPTEKFVVNREVGAQVQNAVERVLESGVAQESELVWKDSSGVMRYFQGRYVPEFGTDGTVESVLGITRDITSLRRTEAQLLHVQKMESIGTLAGGVAHDFNNILTVIGGYAELLCISLKDDERRFSFAHEISASVVRGAEMTKSLLMFSGKHEPQKQYDNLNRIVANLQKSMSRLLRSDITLTFMLSADQLPIFADRIQIEQILINLIVNARDALASGGRIHIETSRVDIDEELVAGGATLSPGSYGLVTVGDDGTGMDAETVGRIFEPFFTTKELGKGTGLGLAIVFGIVGNNNGQISVESEPGKGSTFGLYLPIYTGDEPQKNVPVPDAAEFYGNETILVVDDDQTVLTVTVKLLNMFGYTTLTATDGVEAVAVFEAHRDEIQAVVTDLMMPRMNGREAIELIRRQKPGLPVILASGYTDDIIDLAAIEALDVIFLQKPLLLKKLLAAIRDGLNR